MSTTPSQYLRSIFVNLNKQLVTGGPALEIVGRGTKVYAIQLRQVSTEFIDGLTLTIGKDGLPLRLTSIGETFYFADPVTTGVYLALNQANWPVRLAGPFNAFVEFVVATEPGMQIPQTGTDPWRFANGYDGYGKQLGGGATQYPLVGLFNPVRDGLPTAARLLELLISSDTAGEVLVGWMQGDPAGAGFTGSTGQPRYVAPPQSDPPANCLIYRKSDTVTNQTAVFKPFLIPPGVPVLLTTPYDIAAPDGSTADTAYGVLIAGVKGTTTLEVGFTWKERLLSRLG